MVGEENNNNAIPRAVAEELQFLTKVPTADDLESMCFGRKRVFHRSAAAVATTRMQLHGSEKQNCRAIGHATVCRSNLSLSPSVDSVQKELERYAYGACVCEHVVMRL